MRFLRVLLALVLTPCVALADPVLLADFDPPIFPFTTTCQTCSINETFFQVTSTAGEGDPTAVSLFSGAFTLASGVTGVFDFDETNAPGFLALSQRLTDALNANLIFSFTFFTANDRAGEASAFGSLLTGDLIDFLRLVVDQNGGIQTSDGLKYTLDARWEVWGNTVAEPATLSLVVLGLAGTALARRRRQPRD